MRNHTTLWSSVDWPTITIYLVLVIAGWFSICGATYNFDIAELFTSGSRPIMQAVWIGLGLLIAFSVLMISPHIFESQAPLFYGLMVLLCLVTIFVAPDIKGSRSWLVLGPLRLQPAEFTKISTALVLAWLCNQHGFKIESPKSYILILCIIFTPILLIIGQSETGSALVFFSLFLALYREGFTGLFMGLGGAMASYFCLALIYSDTTWWEQTNAALFLVTNCIIAYSLIFFTMYGKRISSKATYIALSVVVIESIGLVISRYIYSFDLAILSLILLILLSTFFIYYSLRESMLPYLLTGIFSLGSLGFFFSTNYVFNNILQPHQQVRIKLALGIEEDIRGKGYNVDQSKIAIGSGGLLGKGFLEGTQTKLNYVPEQDTDFIFCTVGEEQGFVGSSLLILTYAVFILRLCVLAERQTSTFGRVYGYSIASIFFFHLFINVGMVLGLIPVIGIPLPFFSYGGSSLWGFSFMLFIFLGIDARRENRHL